MNASQRRVTSSASCLSATAARLAAMTSSAVLRSSSCTPACTPPSAAPRTATRCCGVRGEGGHGQTALAPANSWRRQGPPVNPALRRRSRRAAGGSAGGSAHDDGGVHVCPVREEGFRNLEAALAQTPRPRHSMQQQRPQAVLTWRKGAEGVGLRPTVGKEALQRGANLVGPWVSEKRSTIAPCPLGTEPRGLRRGR